MCYLKFSVQQRRPDYIQFDLQMLEITLTTAVNMGPGLKKLTETARLCKQLEPADILNPEDKQLYLNSDWVRETEELFSLI